MVTYLKTLLTTLGDSSGGDNIPGTFIRHPMTPMYYTSVKRFSVRRSKRLHQLCLKQKHGVDQVLLTEAVLTVWVTRAQKSAILIKGQKGPHHLIRAILDTLYSKEGIRDGIPKDKLQAIKAMVLKCPNPAGVDISESAFNTVINEKMRQLQES